MNNVIALAPLGHHQEQDLSERQTARALGIDLKDFRQAQCSRVLPPATWQDEQGNRYWNRESVRAVVDLYMAMSKGRDTQHLPTRHEGN